MTLRTPTVESTPFYRSVQTEDDFSYCVFASQRMIDEINLLPPESRHYYMDGTFKVVPYGASKHLLIIHVEFCGKVYQFYLSLS